MASCEAVYGELENGRPPTEAELRAIMLRVFGPPPDEWLEEGANNDSGAVPE